MRIEHIAIWTKDIETVRDFYIKFFNAACGTRYENKSKGFSSYFLSFDSGARIEVMHRTDISNEIGSKGFTCGLAHFAISVGSKKLVDELTELIRSKGFEVLGEPRTTGDGYYESVVVDPEGNIVEITE